MFARNTRTLAQPQTDTPKLLREYERITCTMRLAVLHTHCYLHIKIDCYANLRRRALSSHGNVCVCVRAGRYEMKIRVKHACHGANACHMFYPLIHIQHRGSMIGARMRQKMVGVFCCSFRIIRRSLLLIRSFSRTIQFVALLLSFCTKYN